MIGSGIRKHATLWTLSLAAPLAQAQAPGNQLPPEAFFWGTASLISGPVMVIVVIAIVLFFNSRREQRRYDLFARFVDKGQDIPRELLPQPPSRQREMIRGVWLLCIGLGIGLVLYIATSDWTVAAWSLILLFLSAASFINAALFSTQAGSGRPTADGD